MFNQQVIPTMNPYVRYGIDDPRRTGFDAGLQDGFNEGYLRGRANQIISRPRAPIPVRHIKVLYVSSGKGFPYSPIDEAIIATLHTLVAEVTTTDPSGALIDLASSLRPDLILALDGMALPLDQMDAIRALGIRTAVWLTDDPYYTDVTLGMATHFDYIFTLERNCVELYRSQGAAQVHYLPFAAYHGHFRPTVAQSPVRRSVSFIGSAYWNRVSYLQPVLGGLMEKGLHINGIWWDRLPEFAQYPNQIEIGKWMGPEDTAEAYSGSKIVLNLHRSPLDESVNQNGLGVMGVSPNPRTFEIAACGTLQLVDAREDMGRFYIPGQEIETFASPEELLDKVNFYLTHENERREIALRALERTYKEHTYGHRLDEMFRIIFG